MCLIAVVGMLLASWTEVQGQSQYSNSNVQQSQNVLRNSAARNAATRTARRQTRVDRVAPPTPATHVAGGFVPGHMKSGIQTGVVAPQQNVVMDRRVRQVSAEMPQRGPRTAQMISETPLMDGGVVGQSVVGHGVMNQSVVGGCSNCGSTSTHTYAGGCASCGAGCSPGFGGPVESVVGEGYFSAGRVDTCGGGCGGSCGLDGCYGRGGCPPSALENCWVNGLAGIFSTGEYFIGGTGFRSTQFQVPGNSAILDDASFGFYGGFNFGMPLCRLTCGVLSGQVGVRAVSSEFDGNSFFSDNRDQTFFTAGLFRRVDYGWQFGLVADVLREEWFTESETVQLRGDLAWVYPSGSALGFRFSTAQQDDITDGIVNGQSFTGLITETLETYRFYYRHTAEWGGYSDFSLGWSDSDHFILGLDYDLPLSETWAMQSSLTYLAGDDVPATSPFAGNGNEVWNLSVGFAWRPTGRSWYRSYDRPMFGVADNGSMIVTRN